MEHNRKAKTVAESQAEQVHIIMPMDINSGETLFGGQLMQWIDVVAGVVSRRHSGCTTRTAAVERLDFLAPAYINDILVLKGRVIYVGNTSMEVCIDTYVERLSDAGNALHVNRALLTMVAVDQDGVPTTVPELIISTDEEKQLWQEADQRRKLRKVNKPKLDS